MKQTTYTLDMKGETQQGSLHAQQDSAHPLHALLSQAASRQGKARAEGKHSPLFIPI